MNKVFETISAYIEKHNFLVFSIVDICIGLLIIIFNNKLFTSFMEILLTIMLLACIKDLIGVITKKKSTKLSLWRAMGNTIFAVVALYFINISLAVVTMIFALYLLFNGIIKLVSYALLKINQVPGGLKTLFAGVITSGLGITMFFSPLLHLDTMLYIVGGYSVLLGISYLIDYIDGATDDINVKRIKIPLPTIIEALIPFSILQKINKIVSNENKNMKPKLKEYDGPVDMEIFIHVSEKGMGKFGHVDLCYNGEVISYGNYDADTRKFHEVFGAGVVFKTDRKKYIKFCIEHSSKTLFGFGIKLTAKQNEKVQKELARIQENLVEWKPPYVIAKENHEIIKKDEYKDYSSMLYKSTKAKFYKFKKTKYKAYFVLGTNCGTLADKIINSSGADILNMNGIVTPGTYYDFLEREYLKKGSCVVRKRIYHELNKNNIED